MDPLYTLEVAITKTEQAEPSLLQHSIVIKSCNLSLANTIEMQNELAPALLGWLKQDEA